MTGDDKIEADGEKNVPIQEQDQIVGTWKTGIRPMESPIQYPLSEQAPTGTWMG